MAEGMPRIGVYPGTFDPITLGHLDIIRRGAKLVDQLIIGVTTNPSKNPMFTPEERMAMVEREVASQGIANVSVMGFNALLMKFAERQGANVIVRGLRAVADFVDGLVARLLGAGTDDERAEEELVSAIEDIQRQGLIDEQAATILGNAVEFGDTTVGAIMTPRPAIEGIEYTDDIEVIREFARKSGHSRIPVYRGSLDHVDGILYVKDLVSLLGAPAEGFRLRPSLRAPQRVPESKPLREQLRDFQQSKVHFAVVLDEFGGTAGIVTIEDVIEELVGEIRDEHEPVTDVHPVVRPLADGSFEASGRVDIADLNAALGTEIPEDDGYETVAGFVLAHFGSIPRTGDSFVSHGIRFEVAEATATAVLRIRARREPDAG
jgi:cytidyltransferase-like protein